MDQSAHQFAEPPTKTVARVSPRRKNRSKGWDWFGEQFHLLLLLDNIVPTLYGNKHIQNQYFLILSYGEQRLKALFFIAHIMGADGFCF